MRRFGLSCTAMCLSAIIAWSAIRAADPPAPPPAEPGYKWVAVTEYREVCRDVCKLVPDVKETKKWVYSQIDDPFCLKRSGHACDESCARCEGPYCRKQLVKRLVVCKEPTTKCIVEKIVEKVPCTVYKKVPCADPVEAAPRKQPER